jgi:hypothetical protein
MYYSISVKMASPIFHDLEARPHGDEGIGSYVVEEDGSDLRIFFTHIKSHSDLAIALE